MDWEKIQSSKQADVMYATASLGRSDDIPLSRNPTKTSGGEDGENLLNSRSSSVQFSAGSCQLRQ